jgi:2-polyprenyl-6-methoxyphenol hydroxylase-like FAD-dependent oxidoreductase
MYDAPRHDVVIIGASLAGCTAARLFAQEGLSVALVERHSDLDWHKRMCTHYIQACAVETIQRLGLERLLEKAGAVRSRMEIWTRYGWIRHAGVTPSEMHGYSIRRQTLDPIVRRLAAETPGVELFMGRTAYQLLNDGDRLAGVALRDQDGKTLDLPARLVVAADGRNSSVAKLARVPTWSRPNNRFAYFAYYRRLPLASGNDSQFWLLDPDAAYALPDEDGITLLCCWITKDKLEAFRGDRERSFERFMGQLPRGPDLARSERISEVLGALDLPVEVRGGAYSGLALIGDAALSPDPLWGVGCGWAFQSAQWLVDCTAAALSSGGDLNRALKRYHARHRAALGAHYMVIADYARGRRFSFMEKLYVVAGARDPAIAETLLAFGARRTSPWRLVAPLTLGRAVLSNLRRSKAPLGPAIPEPHSAVAGTAIERGTPGISGAQPMDSAQGADGEANRKTAAK